MHVKYHDRYLFNFKLFSHKLTGAQKDQRELNYLYQHFIISIFNYPYILLKIK